MKNYMENKLKKGNFSFAFSLARRHPLFRPNLRSISSTVPFALFSSSFAIPNLLSQEGIKTRKNSVRPPTVFSHQPSHILPACCH